MLLYKKLLLVTWRLFRSKLRRKHTSLCALVAAAQGELLLSACPASSAVTHIFLALSLAWHVSFLPGHCRQQHQLETSVPTREPCSQQGLSEEEQEEVTEPVTNAGRISRKVFC